MYILYFFNLYRIVYLIIIYYDYRMYIIFLICIKQYESKTFLYFINDNSVKGKKAKSEKNLREENDLTLQKQNEEYRNKINQLENRIKELEKK